MEIRGKSVRLRAIEKADLALLHRWGNEPEVQYWLGGWHFPSSMDQMERWLERIQADSLNQRFAIQTEEEGLIGTANLVDINWKDRNAFHGMLLGEKETRGKGYGVDTVMAMMRFAFEELRLERLDSSIIEYNVASIRLYCEKCGWETEGRKKNCYWRKNRFWDKFVIGITRDGYADVLKRTNYWA